MKRLIIDYPDDMIPELAVQMALQVVFNGYVSEAAGIQHLCWATTFGNGYGVYARRKKSAASADSLTIRKVLGREVAEGK